ncbi:hypothetical protein K9857_07035 [Pseudomonas sp. REP124]|uniref:hypothetical protein n=1 Tax=Pseudomonas sp. REP124 TaxID=2875731 RepID=UPI001CCE807C|nr:hypothetical protein [Pseudomonas sp. REP124]MBZ9781309.1 hypothetical protein [Pseudomonas sp. REP124]
MSTDRQKSFIANLSVDDRQLHFLEAFNGGPVYVAKPLFSGGVFTGRPPRIDHSHFLALRTHTSADPIDLLTIYFRHTSHGYTLYIRTPGQYYGKCLGSDKGKIGALRSEESSTFNLINKDHCPINLDCIEEDTTTIFLQVKNSGLIHAHNVHDSGHTYIGDKGGTPLSFKLNILQRNAPYINHPDEV